jgi:hypothetical protein
MFGYPAALAAAGLFAGLGLTQDLGALATYDATSLMLVAAAAYCAVRTGPDDRHAGRWLLLVPLMLLAANATKHVTVVFDPVVIGLTASRLAGQGWRRVLQRAGVLGAVTGASSPCPWCWPAAPISRGSCSPRCPGRAARRR